MIGCVSDCLFTLTLLKSFYQLGVELAMQNVHDIPEADLIDTLRDCISAHLAMQKEDGPTMDVDPVQQSSRTPLSLERMVSLLVGYPVSAPPFRVALRDILSNAEEITAVLKVLVTWVKAWGENGAIIRTNGETNERDLMKRGSKSGGNKGALLPLDLVSFTFITCTYPLVSSTLYKRAYPFGFARSRRSSITCSTPHWFRFCNIDPPTPFFSNSQMILNPSYPSWRN